VNSADSGGASGMATMAVPMHTCSAAASTVLGSLRSTPPVVCSTSASSSSSPSSSSLGYKKSVSGFSFSLGFVSQPLGISKVSSSRIRDSFPRVLARAPGAKERDKSSSQEREAAALAEEEAAAAAVQGDVYDDEEEVEISWIQEKVEDVVLVTSQAMERVPGPRVGDGQLPWLVAVPLGYLGITFVIAVVRSWRKFNSSKERRKRQIGNNAYFCEALGEYLPEKREQLDHKKLQALAIKVSLLSMLSHKPSSWMTCCNCKSFFVLSFSIYCFLKHGISASSPGLLTMYMLAIVSQLANVMDLELRATFPHRNISLFFGMPM
jgi:hypothetical protein